MGAVVKKIAYNNSKYLITYLQNGETCQTEADYCFSNMPIPLMKDVLEDGHFEPSFREALHAVYQAQDRDRITPEGKYQAGFLADTTKVGWQAPRNLWQEAPGSGAVPIFGGISWSSDEIVQVWYPSDNYHAELGVLTGAYNFQQIAYEWGQESPSGRLENARQGARNLGGNDFAHGLAHGLAIAWQNVPYLQGGWANWSAVAEKEPGAKNATYFNALLQGDKDFYIIGDQLSALPGWQEGAVASAINAVNKVTDPQYLVPELDFLPDTRLMVECL
ncbi:monoamine oxidase [Xenococcus sp. PCC 7305]|nr:monoamine oxidase [Xenococcus sp. PCC 7305]